MSVAGVQVAWLETLADCPNCSAWVFDRVAPHLAGPVLEIGSGTGTYTALIAARGLTVTAVEIDPALAARARRQRRTGGSHADRGRRLRPGPAVGALRQRGAARRAGARGRRRGRAAPTPGGAHLRRAPLVAPPGRVICSPPP